MDDPERSVSPLRTAVVLAVFAALTTGAVALVHEHSAARIAANDAQARRRQVAEILPEQAHDNVPHEDRITVTDELLGGVEQPVYRARRAGEPVASVIQVIAHDGYNGSIVLLVGIDVQGNVLAVRALQHRETPGLGDAIEMSKDDWIASFDGASLAAPRGAWAVRRDGGEFDQLTGATVTSRAVVGAVHDALLYFDLHSHSIFTLPGEQ